MNVTLLIIVALILLVVRYVTKYRTNLQLPAVRGLPLIGSLLQLNKQRPDTSFMQWARELGPVYTVRLLHKTWVVVSGYEELQEMLVTKGFEFGGRNRVFVQEAILGKEKDLITGNPTEPTWKPLRMAAHRGIRHYGDGLTRLEQTLAAMARDFVVKVTSYGGQPVNLQEDIYNYVVKVAVTMISGRRVTDDSDSMLRGMVTLERLVSKTTSVTSAVELELFPWLLHLGHPQKRRIQEIRELRNRLWDSMWEESQKSYTSDGEASCTMHAIAQLIDKDSSHFYPDFRIEHAKGLFTNLLLASVVTTTKFSYALPNILLHHPHVLKRVQQEVDEIIGTDRQPSIFDREAMPYSVATILELLRYAALVTTVPHAALVTATLGGYTIPAGTNIMPLFPAVLHDKKFWGDPDMFRPDRFLDTDGSLLPADHPNRKHLLVFGAGTRACVGEQFAQKRLFIFLTSIVQTFDLRPATDDSSIPLTPCDRQSLQGGIILQQRPYSIRLIARRPLHLPA